MKIDYLPAAPDVIGSELEFGDVWDAQKVRALIDQKTQEDRKPSFLFVGSHEAQLLRYHLGCAFGPANVCTLKNLYYMGLEVVELNVDRFLRTAVRKRVENFLEESGHIPEWKDIYNGNVWRNVNDFTRNR